MKTEVIMKREIFGEEISQKSKSEFFSATDLVKAGNRWRMLNKLTPFDMSSWLQQKGVKSFISALEEKYGVVLISGRGRGKHTWVHPFLFIDMALAISNKLKIEVYTWLYDFLLRYRNDSGDSYKKMSGSLFVSYTPKVSFHSFIISVAKVIKKSVGVKDWNKATEDQLKTRDRIHENIALLADILPTDQAVRIGIKKALEANKIEVSHE